MTRTASTAVFETISSSSAPAGLVGQARVLPHCFEQTCDLQPDAVAVVCGQSELTYQELDHRANQLARLLVERGCGAGSTVGILLERSIDTYVALLGVLKCGAAYVPLDPSFPTDRLAFITQDAGLDDLVTRSELQDQTRDLDCRVLELDQVAEQLIGQPGHRLDAAIDPESACYVIYTSGSTGKPKGVAISHASIVNFLRVATPVYGVTSEDRVYQGMSISFDFHLEEVWPAWVAGATLIAGPTDSRRFGQGLTDFLTEHQVTVLCSVPTLLTTVEDDPASVRCLLVSGEPMPADLVRRWSRPGRRILNAYGPTETTISSSCAELRPDRPVTLGRPFSTYRFYVLDDQLREVRDGEIGEICIGGPGVGIGYLNRPELTAERFVPNPVEADRVEVPRVYRTGDLGRRISTGEYEYLGRIDTQVKIRGYRIELGEIEELIREDTAVKNAVVTVLERDGTAQDLIGYVTLHRNGNGNGNGAGELRERLHGLLRRRLPPYMIPSFIEVLDGFPLLAADKVNRKALPAPTSPPLGARTGPHIPADTALEIQLSEVWQQVLGVEQISVEDDFFCDLGGHSLAAARVVSQLRKQPTMAGLGMRDLYAHPTIRGLAQFVENELAVPAGDAAVAEPDGPAPIQHSTGRFIACGLAQLVLLYTWLLIIGSPVLVLAYAVQLRLHIFSDPVPDNTMLATLAGIGLVPLALACIGWLVLSSFCFPIVASRLLLRGIQPGWYPLWGWVYLRMWFCGRVLAFSPLPVLAGSPMISTYLRLLGAKVGRDCHLASALINLPVLVELGEGVSIASAARVQPYYVQDGWLRLAPIRMGSGSFLGTSSLILAGAEIGENSSAGDQSLVHAGLRIPPDEHWAGSPIARLAATPALQETLAERADNRPWPLSVLLGFTVALAAMRVVPWLVAVPGTLLELYIIIHSNLAGSMAGMLVAGPLMVFSTLALLILIKRGILPSRIRPGFYPERTGFAVRHWLSTQLTALSVAITQTLYCTLYVIPFLRLLGAKLGRWSEVATPAVIDPDMTDIGDQTFLAGGVITAPAICHRGCIALATAQMGDRSFLGNEAVLPGGSRMSDNSLLGVFSIPPTRPIEPETTWLGSPAFFLPRREASKSFPAKLIDAPTPAMIALRLVIEFFRVTLPTTVLGMATVVSFYTMLKLTTVLPTAVVLALLPALGWVIGIASTLVVVVLKWLIMGRYRPRVEPYWGLWVRGTEFITGMFEAVAVRSLLTTLLGTPWLAPFLRLFGAKIGRRVWLNTTAMTEFDLVEIGDDAELGDSADLLTHLFEDRVMKMSRIKVGARASVGTRATLVYDSEIGADAHIDAFSLLMKGESLPPASRWRGLPARPL